MRFQSHCREALSNLLSAKLRSILAVLGVLVGTASVVALVSGGQLATEHALQQFKKLGTDIFSVNISGTKSDSTDSAKENLNKLHEIKERFTEVKSIAPYSIGGGQIKFNNSTINASVVGVDHNYQEVLKLNMSKGRFVTALDDDEYYAIIGDDVYHDLRKNGALEVLGNQILINGQYFTIIGVLSPTEPSLFVFTNLNKSIVLPILPAMRLSRETNIRNLVITVHTADQVGTLKPKLLEYFQAQNPAQRVYIGSPQEIINSMKSQRQTFNLLLSFIGSIALVVGGIGVMNIMLVSVVERRKEIGIRLAVGAKRRDIQYMFLTEAVALTLFGGFLGVLLGEAIAFGTAMISGWEFYFYMLPPLIGFFVSALTGIFFGLYPARKASMLDPIESLRSD